MRCFKLVVSGVMVFFLLTVNGNSNALAQGPSAAEYGVVLNLAGKQRMLSQKMSKEVLLVNLNYEKEKNLENLKATAALFDKTLKGLRNGDASLGLPPTVSRRILRQIDKKVQPIWDAFHASTMAVLADRSVNGVQLQAVAQKNLPLLSEMNKCVKLYEKDAAKAGLKANPGLAVAINLAGKQRMLTQKMSKEFFLIASDYEVESNRLNLQETYRLFERTLNGLLDGDATLGLSGTSDEVIRAQLMKVQGMWDKFKPSVAVAVKETGAIPKDKLAMVADGNLPLLKEMNNAVKMYEALAAK
ncbi:MAG: type IV pili methyl-accepting chemotaxis transducer N-terminal domain-containing protein [Desulfobacter sp.]